MPPEPIIDHSTMDFNRIVAGKEDIRKLIPQRYEMEHLDGIVHLDTENHIVVGYKDVKADEFWVRGHFPNFPILPGVIMCECAAQLCSFYVCHLGLNQGNVVGFFGLENTRFRAVVKPGERLILLGKPIRLHRRQTIFNVQGFVGKTMAFHSDVIGVPLPAASGT